MPGFDKVEAFLPSFKRWKWEALHNRVGSVTTGLAGQDWHESLAFLEERLARGANGVSDS